MFSYNNFIWSGFNFSEFESFIQNTKFSLNLNYYGVKENMTFIIDVCNFMGQIKHLIKGYSTDAPLIPTEQFCTAIVKKLQEFILEISNSYKNSRFVFIVQNIPAIVNPLKKIFNIKNDARYEMYCSIKTNCSDDDKVLWHVAYHNWKSNYGKTVIISNDSFKSEFVSENNNSPVRFMDVKNKSIKTMVSNCQQFIKLSSILPKINMRVNVLQNEICFREVGVSVWPDNKGSGNKTIHIPDKGSQMSYFLLSDSYVNDIIKEMEIKCGLGFLNYY